MIDAHVPLALAAQAVGPLSESMLQHVLLLSAALFCLGVIGFLSRRNLIIMFLCTELMFQGAGLAFIAFGRHHMDASGPVFVIFVLTVAAAEAALGLALVVYLFRQRETLDASAWAEMKG